MGKSLVEKDLDWGGVHFKFLQELYPTQRHVVAVDEFGAAFMPKDGGDAAAFLADDLVSIGA
jgi:hypothetical protein